MSQTSPGEQFTGASLTTLLGRPLRDIPVVDGVARLAGARILVLGAGGSVGSGVVARLAALRPERVVALDIHEASLFRLGRDAPPGLPLDLQLADIRNGAKLTRLFASVRPDVVLHFAAYKHVPIGERSPDEPVSVNVLATDTVIRAAIDAGVGHLIYTSSDKAVNPPSIYGGTKRLAEVILHAHAASQNTTAIHVLRYVNIIGSSGSALETFAAQARAGQPLTITDSRMTRYWMAMDEAVALCWHALGLESGSHTMLDVGDATPVPNIAARVAMLVRPDVPDPAMVETGARPGERLFEELASANERLTHCGSDSIWHIARHDDGKRLTMVPAMLAELHALLEHDDLTTLRARVMELSQLLQ